MGNERNFRDKAPGSRQGRVPRSIRLEDQGLCLRERGRYRDSEGRHRIGANSRRLSSSGRKGCVGSETLMAARRYPLQNCRSSIGFRKHAGIADGIDGILGSA